MPHDGFRAGNRPPDRDGSTEDLRTQGMRTCPLVAL